jgi:hypothetical protein
LTYVTEEQRSRTGWIALGVGWLRHPTPVAGGRGNPPRVPSAILCQMLVEILADGTSHTARMLGLGWLGVLLL